MASLRGTSGKTSQCDVLPGSRKDIPRLDDAPISTSPDSAAVGHAVAVTIVEPTAGHAPDPASPAASRAVDVARRVGVAQDVAAAARTVDVARRPVVAV